MTGAMLKLFRVLCDDEVDYLVAAEREDACKALVLRDEWIVEADGPQAWRFEEVDPSKNNFIVRVDDGRGLVSVSDLFASATEPGVLCCSEWA